MVDEQAYEQWDLLNGDDPPVRYFVDIMLDESMIRAMLSIPDKFELVAVHEHYESNSIVLRLRCPEEDKYAVPASYMVNKVLGAVIRNKETGQLKLYFPDLLTEEELCPCSLTSGDKGDCKVCYTKGFHEEDCLACNGTDVFVNKDVQLIKG